MFNVSFLSPIQSDLVDQASENLKQFRTLLSDQKYGEAAVFASSMKGDFLFKEFIFDLIKHGNSSESAADLRVVIDVFTAEERSLDTEWLRAVPSLFQFVVQSYISNLPSEEIQINVKEVLAGFLNYPQFTLEQAEIIIREILDFDPNHPSNPNFPSSPTFLSYAEIGSNQNIISYFESFPAVKPALLDESVDIAQFCGVEELKGTTFDLVPSEGEFMRLDSLQTLYRLIGKNLFLEGDQEFFKREVELRRERFSLSQLNAFKSLREAYWKIVTEYESVKVSLAKHHMEVFCTKNLSIDTTISGGRENVGTLSFNNEPAVYKRLSTISSEFPCSNFSDIYIVIDFINRARSLRAAVSNIIEIFPYLILNQKDNGDIDIGYLMKVEPGEQLRKISKLSAEEKVEIQQQFDRAVDLMLQCGYALYDFSDDNVLWDGKKLTFIDLSAAGFKPLALQCADTGSVKWRMSAILGRKSE